jgi:hypothetical protein
MTERLCRWPECMKPVKDDALMCYRHWYALPEKLRYRIRRAFNAGIKTQNYIDAVREADEFAKKRFAEVHPPKETP